jgi:hypothetical protein
LGHLQHRFDLLQFDNKIREWPSKIEALRARATVNIENQSQYKQRDAPDDALKTGEVQTDAEDDPKSNR